MLLLSCNKAPQAWSLAKNKQSFSLKFWQTKAWKQDAISNFEIADLIKFNALHHRLEILDGDASTTCSTRWNLFLLSLSSRNVIEITIAQCTYRKFNIYLSIFAKKVLGSQKCILERDADNTQQQLSSRNLIGGNFK